MRCVPPRSTKSSKRPNLSSARPGSPGSAACLLLAALVAAAPAAAAESPLSKLLRRLGYVELQPPRDGRGAGTVVALRGEREVVVSSPDPGEASCVPAALLPVAVSRPADFRREVDVDGAGGAELALARAAAGDVDVGAAFRDSRVRSIHVTLGDAVVQSLPAADLERHLATLSADDACLRELARPGSYVIVEGLEVRGVAYRFVGGRGAPVPLDETLRALIGLVAVPSGTRIREDTLEIAFPILVGARYARVEPDLGFAGSGFVVSEARPRDLPPTAGRNGGPAAADVPSFPWPPPHASTTDVLPDEMVRAAPAMTLGDLDRRLQAALESAGYLERRYYAAPGGFALVTRLEQIQEDGTPRQAPERWSTEVPGLAEFSLRAYLRALFFAARGRYRLIVLVATDVPFAQAATPITAASAETLLAQGLNRLPAGLAAQPFTRDAVVTALIYEFERVDTGAGPELVAPSQLQARVHLQKAAIWQGLQR